MPTPVEISSSMVGQRINPIIVHISLSSPKRCSRLAGTGRRSWRGAPSGLAVDSCSCPARNHSHIGNRRRFDCWCALGPITLHQIHASNSGKCPRFPLAATAARRILTQFAVVPTVHTHDSQLPPPQQTSRSLPRKSWMARPFVAVGS